MFLRADKSAASVSCAPRGRKMRLQKRHDMSRALDSRDQWFARLPLLRLPLPNVRQQGIQIRLLQNFRYGCVIEMVGNGLGILCDRPGGHRHNRSSSF